MKIKQKDSRKGRQTGVSKMRLNDKQDDVTKGVGARAWAFMIQR